MPRNYKKPMFSKRHYEKIAEILRECTPEPNFIMSVSATLQHEGLIKVFASEFKADNPNFKPDKFLRACGIED